MTNTTRTRRLRGAEKDRADQDAMRSWFGQPPIEPTWEEKADAVFARLI